MQNTKRAHVELSELCEKLTHFCDVVGLFKGRLRVSRLSFVPTCVSFLYATKGCFYGHVTYILFLEDARAQTRKLGIPKKSTSDINVYWFKVR